MIIPSCHEDGEDDGGSVFECVCDRNLHLDLPPKVMQQCTREREMMGIIVVGHTHGMGGYDDPKSMKPKASSSPAPSSFLALFPSDAEDVTASTAAARFRSESSRENMPRSLPPA